MLSPATMFNVSSELQLNSVTEVPSHLMFRVLFVLELVLPEMVMVPLLSDETETPFVPVILTLFETEFQSFRIKWVFPFVVAVLLEPLDFPAYI